MQIPFVIATNKARSSAVNGTRLVNCYAEAQPKDSKNQVVLYGTPGTYLFCKLADGPVYGMQRQGQYIYAVSATRMYRFNSSGVVENLGPVNFTGRVDMASNGETVVAVDGNKGFYYNEEKGVRQLTGDGWYPANSVTYQDGYFIFNRKGTGQFFLSELLSVEFDPLKFATAEGAPDDALKVLSDHRELWVWGETTTEVWYNSGNPDFPFERMQGAFIEKGIGAPDTAAKLDNSVFWLGNDGIVYRAGGYQPQRISNHAVEFSIESADVSDAFAYTYINEGHSFYVITFPSIERTWCFDVSTGLWHERSNIDTGRHHSNCYARNFDKHVVGDFRNGNVYVMDMATGLDNNSQIIRLMESAMVHSGRKRLVMYSFELDMQSGVGLVNGQGSDPQAMLQWSDDGGETWSNEHWRSIGKIGEYKKRVKWNRLGIFRQRQFRLTISDPVPVVVISANAEVKGARS